jgi:hypothetical protein
MNNFDVKDHGVREEMKTGSRRDTQQGKPRYDLVPATCLTKLALHYGAGSEKYGDRNWEKGQPITRYMSSAERHFQYFKMGLTDENHLMACVWNLFCIDWTLDQIAAGKLPKELDDRTPEMLGAKICTDLFNKIEQNVRAKLEKCSKNNDVAPEKRSTITFGDKDKKPENVKNDKSKSVENVKIEPKNIVDGIKQVIPVITGKDEDFINITNIDDSFICIMLANGKFMTYDKDKGIRYSNKNIDFFDTGYENDTTDAIEKEVKRLSKEGIKYVVISEDIFDDVCCNNKTGLLYGYNSKTQCLEFIKKINEIKISDIGCEFLDKYKMFTVGVME